MEITVNLEEEDIKAIKDHLVFRIQWIDAEMDEKEALDIALAKVWQATEENKK